MKNISDKRKKNKLKSGVRFSLFVTSYLPLFLIIIVKQISSNIKVLQHKTSFDLFRYFGLSAILTILIIIGIAGLIISLKRISRTVRDNGSEVKINDVKNRNSEAINYIGTYIIPFLFKDYNSGYELFSILSLLIVIYFIYINSTLILINPTLNIFYSLYEVDFIDNLSDVNPKIKRGLIITKEKYLEEGDTLYFEKIGQKLYFGV